MVERLGAPAWLGSTLIVGVALLGSTWFWVGAGDAIAVGGAALTTVSGVGAAWWRRKLDALPLELAGIAAVRDGLREPGITVRAWLGRGRRVEAVDVEARMDGRSLVVLVHPGPLVGRFQAVISGLPEGHESRDLEVSVRARAEGREWRVDRVYGPESRKAGRFVAGITSRGGVSWEPGVWGVLE